MGRDEHCLAAAGERVECLPEAVSQNRVETDGRLVEDEHAGSLSSAVASETRARSPPESVDDHLARRAHEVDGGQRAIDGRPVASSTRAK